MPSCKVLKVVKFMRIEQISSRKNPLLQQVKKLLSSRSEREAQGLFVADGTKLLEEAVAFCRERGLEFYAVNRDYPEEEKEHNNHFSRKLKADLWIDDRNLGGLPDWGTIYKMVHNKLTYEALMNSYEEDDYASHQKKGWFNRLFGKNR